MPLLYVDLAIPVAVDKIFSYSVPEDLRSVARRGVRVLAPLGRRTVVGFIVGAGTTPPALPTIRPILDVLDAEPLLPEELLDLTRWMADYYFAPWGEVLKAVLVQGTARAPKRIVTLLTTTPDLELRNLQGAPQQAEIVRMLAPRRTLSVSQIQKRLRMSNIAGVLSPLIRKGIVEVSEERYRPAVKTKVESVVMLDERSKDKWQQALSAYEPGREPKRLARQHAILRQLLQHDPAGGSVPVPALLKSSGSSLSTLKTLARRELVVLGTREVIRSADFDLHQSALGTPNIILNPDQENALRAVTASLGKGAFAAFLLHGVTGSGKTQVYIDAIKVALARNRTAIVLVPEISLTPQIVRRFKFHFGELVAVLHSRLSPGERYDAWRLAWEGKCSVVIGPRSAVFAPLKNLGLIVVDEEQESSYKQYDQTPRYHARDVAVMRARQNDAVVVLGSATPSFESYSNALSGKFTLLTLPRRVDNAMLPRIEIVDMTEERRKKLATFLAGRREAFRRDPAAARANKQSFEVTSLSDVLREKIEDRLRKREGIILLQNRRGWSPLIECPECGHVQTCENCAISMTYHATKKHLRCHYCGRVEEPPAVCPECGSSEIQYRGFGTQRVEEELRQLYPAASLIRMDLDSTTRRGAHDRMLRKFGEGEADILLGTQMVAKGLDFPRVTLVGVVSADTQMLLPDFRSAERTFQLLTQVAGRAGRSTLAGEVVIQTYQPRHYALQHVIGHDYPAFFSEEMKYRQELSYPPVSRLILIEFRGEREQDVIDRIGAFSGLLRKANPPAILLGPAAAAIPRLHGKYRWHLVLKGKRGVDPSGKILHRTLASVVSAYGRAGGTRKGDVRMVIDVDPVGMM